MRARADVLTDAVARRARGGRHVGGPAALSRPHGTVGSFGGYLGIAANDDVVYIAAHVLSAAVVGATLTLAADGALPYLWSGWPPRLNTRAWPELVFMVILAVVTALARLRTRPRWLWLPSISVRGVLAPPPPRGP